MIVDCHTHVWEYPAHIGEEFHQEAYRSSGKSIAVDLDEHQRVAQAVDHCVVLGFWTDLLDVRVPNDYVATYCARDPKRFIPFASVDPTRADARAELERCVEELHMEGLKLAPIYQGYHPQDRERAYPIYEYCEKHGLPILFHQGTTFPRRAPLEVARPILLERIALDFPELRMVIAHLGHPWEVETIALIRKQPHVYADISALYYRPWQFYNSLTLCREYGVMHKLLFGTDYPFTKPLETMEALRGAGDLTLGTALPKIPADEIEGIIHRDTLSLLGIAR